MRWKKLGVIWQPDGSLWWARKYASCPTPVLLQDGNLRVYIQCRDDKGVGRIGFVDLDGTDPRKVLNVSEVPVLDVGEDGAFDDNGVFQTCVVTTPEGRMLLYYVGFELGHKIRYRLLTGVAESHDGGLSFKRVKSTPVLERTPSEMAFRCGPFVLVDPVHKYRMWYVAGSEWEEIDSKLMPVYELRFLRSDDGIVWPERGETVLALDRDQEHGFGRPYIVPKAGGGYGMFYSIRKKNPRAYRLGYAESEDGLSWRRMDESLNLDVSSEGWDSESVEYAAVIELNGRVFCFYNGNDFGGTGFGSAELISWK